ncbi:sn-glycerol-1-phosphate dehydrogenase [Pectinatus frisingensis]|uniref:sn-glycerol-1-phosphate dehydrogenase n=1 Tax=Pectinatus frisingensis TaxID=865 RepID=UPI0018C80656|nr:sn-glycerol-1-phosphate dehydrogenase [Pectinatus frisingensis]
MRNWEDYIDKNITCDCGRNHECDIRHVLLKHGALLAVPEYVKEKDYGNICIIADINTQKAAGKKLYKIFDKNNIKYNKYIFSNHELVPDELSVGKVMTHIPNECDLLIGIGSGIINDLCKYISHMIKADYFIVATAPSMDGYASDVAPLIVDNLKTTYENVGRPAAIIADTAVLKDAPMHLITAGIGDIFGKYVCLTDWKLAHLINDEYYCPKLVNMMYDAVADVAAAADNGIAERNETAVASVMEGLILAGIDMSYSGNSRPASGSEHHMSHYWEMIFLQHGHEGVHHGTKVGVGTVISLMLYQKMAEKLRNTTVFAKPHFDKAEWIKNIQCVYGPAAPGVIALEDRVHKNSDENVARRLVMIEKYKDAIIDLAEKLPSIEEIIDKMKKINAPYLPSQIDVTEEMLRNGIIYAKELRNRYGLLQLLFDCGWQEEIADAVCAQIANIKA